jgi:hypothetical protein
VYSGTFANPMFQMPLNLILISTNFGFRLKRLFKMGCGTSSAQNSVVSGSQAKAGGPEKKQVEVVGQRSQKGTEIDSNPIENKQVLTTPNATKSPVEPSSFASNGQVVLIDIARLGETVEAKKNAPNLTASDNEISPQKATGNDTHNVIPENNVGSGGEDMTEITAVVSSTANPSAGAAICNEADEEDDLLLSFDFVLLLPDVHLLLTQEKVSDTLVQDLFEIVDKNGDGLVDASEREELLQLLQMSCSGQKDTEGQNGSTIQNETVVDGVNTVMSKDDGAVNAVASEEVPLVSVPASSVDLYLSPLDSQRKDPLPEVVEEEEHRDRAAGREGEQGSLKEEAEKEELVPEPAGWETADPASTATLAIDTSAAAAADVPTPAAATSTDHMTATTSGTSMEDDSAHSTNTITTTTTISPLPTPTASSTAAAAAPTSSNSGKQQRAKPKIIRYIAPVDLEDTAGLVVAPIVTPTAAAAGAGAGGVGYITPVTATASASSGVPENKAGDGAGAGAGGSSISTGGSMSVGDIKRSMPKIILPGMPRPPSARLAPPQQQPTEEVSASLATQQQQADDDDDDPNRPPQKKGFIVTRRENFSRTANLPSNGRFFSLENGKLSYMDSTSRKPPFSLMHREVELKGMDITVNKNIMELSPNNRSSYRSDGAVSAISEGGSVKSADSNEEPLDVVVLVMKNEEECNLWNTAIQDHIRYVTSTQ